MALSEVLSSFSSLFTDLDKDVKMLMETCFTGLRLQCHLMMTLFETFFKGPQKLSCTGGIEHFNMDTMKKDAQMKLTSTWMVNMQDYIFVSKDRGGVGCMSTSDLALH